MKKTKIIASLTTLGAVAVATPIVATSCSTTQSGPFNLYFTNKLSNQIAVKSSAITYFTAVGKSNQSIGLQNVVASTNVAGVTASAEKLESTWKLSVTTDATVSVGTSFTLTVKATAESGEVITLSQQMSVVTQNYELSLVDEDPTVCLNQNINAYQTPSKVASEQVAVSGFMKLTDEGNIAWETLGKMQTDSNLVAQGSDEPFYCQIYDSNGSLICNGNGAYTGIWLNIYYDSTTSAPNQPYFRYSLCAESSSVMPELGEYTARISLVKLQDWYPADLATLQFKFKIVDGLKIEKQKADQSESSANCEVKQKSLYSGYEFVENIKDIQKATAIKFTPFPAIKWNDKIDYKVTPYGYTKELPLSIGFSKINDDDNSVILYTPANLLKTDTDTVQFKVTAYVNGKEKAHAIFTAQKASA